MKYPIVYEGTEDDGDATVAEWLAQDGDEVAEGQTIVEIDVEKVIVEIYSPATGTLVQIDCQIDDDVAPGTVLGQVEDAN